MNYKLLKKWYGGPLVGTFHYTRTDQGVDYAPSGPTVLKAIGKAKILATKPPPGWPEGGGILYQLLEGPFKGKVVYTYEGVDAASYLKPGQVVQRGQAIGKLREGGSIEMGWADARGETLAHDRGERLPGNANTRVGKGFLKVLGHIMAPAEAKVAEPPSLGEQIQEQVEHPGQTAKEDAGLAGSAAGAATNALTEGLSGLFNEHAESFALNVVLLLGGAFLVYYGIALMLGVKSPTAKLAKGVTPL